MQALLNAIACGILVFLLFDVLAHANEFVEESLNAATDGCSAAVEISHADVPISATLEPMVHAPINAERATRCHEPLRKDNRRGRMFDF